MGWEGISSTKKRPKAVTVRRPELRTAVRALHKRDSTDSGDEPDSPVARGALWAPRTPPTSPPRQTSPVRQHRPQSPPVTGTRPLTIALQSAGLRPIMAGERWFPTPRQKRTSPSRHKLADSDEDWVPRSPSQSPQKGSPLSPEANARGSESPTPRDSSTVARWEAVRLSAQTKLMRTRLHALQRYRQQRISHRKVAERVSSTVRGVRLRDAFETWHAAALATAAERHLLRQSPQSHSHPNTILPGVDRHPPAPLPTVEPSDITREPPPSADESRAYQGVGLGLGLRRSLEPPEAREAGLLALGYAAAPRLVIGDVFHGGPAAGAQVPQKRGCQHGKKSLNART